MGVEGKEEEERRPSPPLKDPCGGNSPNGSGDSTSSENDVAPKPCYPKAEPENGIKSTSKESLKDSFARLRKALDSLDAKGHQEDIQENRNLDLEEGVREAEEARKRIQVPEFEKPMDLREIKIILTTPIADTGLLAKHSRIYFYDKAKCGAPLYFVSLVHYARMSQLAACFPDGVSVDYFLDLYQKLVGNSLKLEGYSFPKDDDPISNYKLQSILWIPDNDAYKFPERIVFPAKSSKKYDGSLKNLLEMYWALLVRYMEDRKVVNLSETFGADDDGTFFIYTRIQFSCKNWGLESYAQFVEILCQNFDPDEKQFSIIDLPTEGGNLMEQDVYLVVSGKNGEFVRNFERSARAKFYSWEEKMGRKTCQTPPPSRPKERIGWAYEQMDFRAVKIIEEEPDEYRSHYVVAAGNIWNFYMFHVIFVNDIPERDKLLEKIHDMVEHNEEYTVPEVVNERDLVIFPSKSMWRRGLVIRHNRFDGTSEVFDIDTGETNIKVSRDSLRNFTPELYYLPVLTIPVRLSVHKSKKELFMYKPEANSVLGKYLHMMLIVPTRGLQLRFHWWDTTSTSYTPGVWVVSGRLVDILEGEPIAPTVSISRYLLDKFQNRDPKEELPEWPERNPSVEDDWNIAWMKPRLPNIANMLRRYVRAIEDRKRHSLIPMDVWIPTELEVDKNLKDVPIDLIFVDEEDGGAGREPLNIRAVRTGVRRGKSLVRLATQEPKALSQKPGNLPRNRDRGCFKENKYFHNSKFAAAYDESRDMKKIRKFLKVTAEVFRELENIDKDTAIRFNVVLV